MKKENNKRKNKTPYTHNFCERCNLTTRHHFSEKQWFISVILFVIAIPLDIIYFFIAKREVCSVCGFHRGDYIDNKTKEDI